MYFMKNNMSSKRRVFVSGIGIHSSFGYGIDLFSRALKDGVTQISFWDAGADASKRDTRANILKIGARIKPFKFGELLNQLRFTDENSHNEVLYDESAKIVKRTNFIIESLVLAVLEAWKNAKLSERPVDGTRIGLVTAGSNTTLNYSYELYEKYEGNFEYVTPNYALHFMDTDQVGILSKLFSAKAEGFSVGGASASGNLAIIKGMQMIQSGLADVCVVASAPMDLSPFEIAAFVNLNALGAKNFANAPELACRPFDKRHEGFILGQAGSCIILESLDSLEKREHEPLVELRSGVQILDGSNLSAPNLDGEIQVMRAALRQADLDTLDVNYINAHGTSTPMGDVIESEAISSVFRNNLSKVYVNSTKGITGHCLFSAGIVECVASIVQLREGFIHKNRNLDVPINDDIRFVKETVFEPISVAMSNSFGFGGINTCIILMKA